MFGQGDVSRLQLLQQPLALVQPAQEADALHGETLGPFGRLLLKLLDGCHETRLQDEEATLCSTNHGSCCRLSFTCSFVRL